MIDNGELPYPACIAYGGEEMVALQTWKLKNVMLNTEDKKVPGRKIAPRRDRVFMAVLSRLLACANRRCCAAISRLSFDSFCVMMLYN